MQCRWLRGLVPWVNYKKLSDLESMTHQRATQASPPYSTPLPPLRGKCTLAPFVVETLLFEHLTDTKKYVIIITK
jgi:hypothetical protein